MTEPTLPATTFLAVYSDGRRVPVEVRIGVPEPVGHGEWACAVTLTGLYERLAPMHGGDPLQALTLAVGLVRMLLTTFVDTGGRLLFESGEEVPLSAYFGPHEIDVSDPEQAG